MDNQTLYLVGFTIAIITFGIRLPSPRVGAVKDSHLIHTLQPEALGELFGNFDIAVGLAICGGKLNRLVGIGRRRRSGACGSLPTGPLALGSPLSGGEIG